MPRYVERANGWQDDRFDFSDDSLVPDLRVEGPKEVNTGLVTAGGMSIMRVQPPVGFGRDEEH